MTERQTMDVRSLPLRSRLKAFAVTLAIFVGVVAAFAILAPAKKSADPAPAELKLAPTGDYREGETLGQSFERRAEESVAKAREQAARTPSVAKDPTPAQQGTVFSDTPPQMPEVEGGLFGKRAAEKAATEARGKAQDQSDIE